MQKNSLNKVLLIGRLGADPEARYTSAGVPVVSFSLATNELWKQKNGEFAEMEIDEIVAGKMWWVSSEFAIF